MVLTHHLVAIPSLCLNTLGTNIIYSDLREGKQYVIWNHLPNGLCQ